MDPESEDYVVRLLNETSQYVNADDLFQIDFVDAEERATPPHPRAPALLEAVPGGDGSYAVPVGASSRSRGTTCPAPRRRRPA